MVSSQGYIKVRVPKDHPLSDPNGYAYEHDMVMFEATGRLPDKVWLVHHKNDNHADNRFDNLEWKTKADHNHLHNLERGRDAQGRFLPRK